MKTIFRFFGIATVSSLMTVSLLAQSPVPAGSSTTPGICDNSGTGGAKGKGNSKRYGVKDGSGNQGTRPQDGTGYGANKQHPAGAMGGQTGSSRGPGGGMGGRRNNR